MSESRHGRVRSTRHLTLETLERRCLLHGSITLNSGVLQIEATEDANLIEVTLDAGNQQVLASLDGEPPSAFAVSQVQRIAIAAEGGDDRVLVDTAIRLPTVISGGAGSDTLAGGGGDDTIRGNAGPDVVLGRGGADRILGGGGDDILHGGRGRDLVRAAGGDDVLIGAGGADTLEGGTGVDLFDPAATADQRPDFDARTDVDAGTPVTTGSFQDANLRGTRTDLLPGAPDVNDVRHVAGQVDYGTFSNPPTYGPHHGHGFMSDGHVNGSSAPVFPTGAYNIELEDEDLVHNLEHGHVWISFNPSLLSAADLDRLALLTAAYGSGHGVILTARPGNTSAIALVSWAHLQTLEAFELPAIRDFIMTNRGHAPEGFITP